MIILEEMPYSLRFELLRRSCARIPHSDYCAVENMYCSLMIACDSQFQTKLDKFCYCIHEFLQHSRFIWHCIR
jgi:hypothetical protein